MQEREIPSAARRDNNSVEMLRVWIAEKKLHCSMKIGMYRESTNVSETKAWGVILADTTRHLAAAMHAQYGDSQESVLTEVARFFLDELKLPSSPVSGEFL
jgi:hypothetical protein